MAQDAEMDKVERDVAIREVVSRLNYSRDPELQMVGKLLGAAFAADRPTIEHALRRLLTFRVEDRAELQQVIDHADPESQGDEATQPVLSEVVLYALLGKEDARTVRALLGQVCRALGFERALLEREVK